jgi:hypothetical protein
MPWRYTTPLDLIDHWQTLIAGGLALLAAAVTVWVTLRIERRKVEREVDALRKSLAIELRQMIPKALSSHGSLRRLAANPNGQITTRMVENFSPVREPVIYLANAGKIGTLEADAMDVVIVYSLLETARDSIRRMGTSRDPDNINPKLVLQTASIFLEACVYAREVLPKLRTGLPSHDERDAKLIADINTAWEITTADMAGALGVGPQGQS